MYENKRHKNLDFVTAILYPPTKQRETRFVTTVNQKVFKYIYHSFDPNQLEREPKWNRL